MINKNSVIKFAPHVLKRFEPSLERCYLLNFDNDEIWMGNSSINIILAQFDGQINLSEIVNEVFPFFEGFTQEDILKATLPVLQELVEKNFLIEIN